MHISRIILLVLCGILVMPQSLFAATATFTSELDFTSAIVQTGVDTVTTPGAISISSLSVAANPAQEMRDIALLVSNDSTVDAEIEFYLEAYFANTFTYGGNDAADDVFEFSAIDDVGDLAGYELLLVDATSTTEAKNVPQDVVDAFADAGGTVVESTLGYTAQRQRDIYAIEQSFTYTAAAIRDLAFDGTYLWTLDDTSPERVLKISPTTGATVATYCAPNTTPRGIEYVSGMLYITDSTADKMHAISPNSLTVYNGICTSPAQGTVYNLSDLTPDSASPWGLTHDGTYFYNVDSTSNKLYKFSISGASLVQANAWDLTLTPRAIDLPRGLAFDGAALHLADMNTNLVYKLSTTDASVLDAFDVYDGWGASDTDPAGIAFVNGDLWVTDDEAGVKKLYNNTSYYRDVDEFEFFSRGNTSFETPSADPKGFAYDGSNFWVADDYNNRLYKLNASTGAVVSSCQTPYSRPSGLAYASGTLYAADHLSDTIYLLDSATCAVASSYASPGTNPKGMVHDGTNLWVADADTDLVYKMNPVTGVVASSFSTPAGSPRGLAWDGTSLWLADESTDLYYELNPATGSTIRTRTVVEHTAEGIAFKDGQLWSVDDLQDRIYNVESTLLAQGQFDAPAGTPQGFTYTGTHIWSVDSGTDSMYKLNAATGAVENTYASSASDPRDITWDGSALWVTTDADNAIHKINPSTGGTITSFSAPAADPTGIVYAFGNLYVSDPITNKIYQVDPADGSNDDNFDAPGSSSGAMAFDGDYVWLHDADERILYKVEFYHDDHEGIVETTRDIPSASVAGIEYINGELWTVDTYFDAFFDDDLTASEPDAVVALANAFTAPYEVGDSFYYTTRNATEGYYVHRRVTNMTETATRKILASSSRGGAVFVHEARGAGNVFAFDFGLLGDNYEVARQTVPAVTFFFNALGIQVHANGDQENTRPTYDSLSADLAEMMTSCSTAFARTQIGTSSSDLPIYSYTYGTAGKPIALYLSGTHGNEEHGYVPTVRWMEDLCAAYLEGDDRALNIFHNYRVIFVPLLNPYGIQNLTRFNANSVDLNRNYGYNWSGFGSSRKGSSAFSEPETQAMRDLVLANLEDIIFVNDAHSAMDTSPGMTWGCDHGEAPPSMLADIYAIFTGKNARRWFDVKGGTTRWLTYDRYTFQDCEKPYFGNWVSSLGLVSSTNEVLGKKDVDTQRMLHTSAWYKSHFDATFDMLSSKYARSVYRIDAGVSNARFQDAVQATATIPEETSVTFRYGSNSTTTAPTTWYADYGSASANRYLFVEMTLARDAFDSMSPSVSDFTVQYGASGGSNTAISSPAVPAISDLTVNGSAETSNVMAGTDVLLAWKTRGAVHYVKVYAEIDGARRLIGIGLNGGTYRWHVPATARGAVTFVVEATDFISTLDSESVAVRVTARADAQAEGEEGEEAVVSPVPSVEPGDYIRARSFSTVYYVDEHYVRHPFSDAQTFFTWQENFSAVEVISDNAMAYFSMGAPMMPKPGVVLVKIESDPKVYEVVHNSENAFKPLLRWIPFESVAVSRYGNDWANYVIDVPVTSFGRFQFGSAVGEVDAASQGMLRSPMIRRDALRVR